MESFFLYVKQAVNKALVKHCWVSFKAHEGHLTSFPTFWFTFLPLLVCKDDFASLTCVIFGARPSMMKWQNCHCMAELKCTEGDIFCVNERLLLFSIFFSMPRLTKVQKSNNAVFMLCCKAYQLSCNFMRHDVLSGFCRHTLSACAANYMIFVNFISVRVTALRQMAISLFCCKLW